MQQQTKISAPRIYLQRNLPRIVALFGRWYSLCGYIVLILNGYTVRCSYNAVNFLPNPHNIHPIVRPLRARYGVILSVQTVSYTTSVTTLMYAISCYIGPRYNGNRLYHDDVIKWKHFSRYWPFVQGIHRSSVNSPHKGQWRETLMFSLICALNKRLNKQWWGCWVETPSQSLWHHCNDFET